ncbi:MAG: tyrosine-type recombinase/integrase [Sedimentisphaerales bacterium]
MGYYINGRFLRKRVGSLNTFLNRAVKWDMVSSNPMDGVEYLKEDDSKKIPALSEEEVQGLLKEANGWFRPVLLAALYTGMREGELISLEWDDVDFKDSVIRICRKPKWVPKSTKRTIRERDIAIPKALADFLKDFRNKKNSSDNRVFRNRDGEELKPGLRKSWTTGLKCANRNPYLNSLDVTPKPTVGFKPTILKQQMSG